MEAKNSKYLRASDLAAPRPRPRNLHPQSSKEVLSDKPLWFPGATTPKWLDESLVGDYGFDPLGLGKPAEYLQYDLDELDQNQAKNLARDVIGTMRFDRQEVNATPFQPYSEAFGLQRF
ncbi:hypothetical protein SUGI_0420150 [Cryptomeria japonica]|nr:hypothetical protein SUGI_0420150 [Cryptomeria japonica]